MSASWTTTELAFIIQDYFSMLMDELNSKPYNKTDHRNRLHTFLGGRSKKSLEFKHMNISAVLRDLGIPYIKGYKPLPNIQRLMVDEVLNYLQANQKDLSPLFDRFAEVTEEQHSLTINYSFEQLLEEPPPKPDVNKVEEPKPVYRMPFKVNYLEREQNNRKLGDAGEELVLKYEKWRLSVTGKAGLADRVDILSYNDNGTDRYIEVKTTKLGKEAPIFFSLNEYDFSKGHASHYYLYRLFNFNTKAKMFNVQGSFDDFCRVEAVAFRGKF
jgi:hypothetical protein